MNIIIATNNQNNQPHIDDEFRAFMPALSDDEYSLLEQSILSDGCRDALIVWQETGILLDGHNRLQICQHHNIPYQTVGLSFNSRYAAMVWIFDNQYGRRNLTDYQRSYLRGQRYKMEKQEWGGDRKSSTQIAYLKTSERLADEYGVSHDTIQRDEKFTAAIDYIGEVAGDEAKSEVLAGATELTKGELILLAGVAKDEPEVAKAAVDELFAGNAKSFKKAIVKGRHEYHNGVAAKASSSDAGKVVTVYQYGDIVRVKGHILACLDNTDAAAIKLLAVEKAALAFCDPPYNANAADYDDGSFVWQQDFLMQHASIVAVTPGISSIQDFMRLTSMPYRWSVATLISNGMTRGALGFGNWIYTALFSSEQSIHRNAQDANTIAISGSDKHEAGAKKQKPPRYLTWLFDLLTKRGDLIIDAFGGSGVSVIVADGLGRRCISFEKDPAMFSDMVARVRGAIDGDPV